MEDVVVAGTHPDDYFAALVGSAEGGMEIDDLFADGTPHGTFSVGPQGGLDDAVVKIGPCGFVCPVAQDEGVLDDAVGRVDTPVAQIFHVSLKSLGLG